MKGTLVADVVGESKLAMEEKFNTVKISLLLPCEWGLILQAYQQSKSTHHYFKLICSHSQITDPRGVS